MPIIRDDGKAYRLYFATDTAVIFSLPGDYNPAGKTFSLAVRAVRDIHTPALAEATGTVSGQIVTFSVDTNTQSFADALAAGISQAWLEIYVADETVLLQRPVSIEPRAGSLEGQPPAPVILYYTAAQVDALLAGKEAAGTAAAAVSAHNTAENPHVGRFDAAGTAANEVDFHNGNAAAHDGNLLPNTASDGDIPIFSGSGWTTRPYGDKVEAVTGDFTAEPGTVYALDLNENKTIYIEAAASADFDFALVVTMGATLRSLTLLPGMVSAILWSDGGNPPDYNADNKAPALDTTLAVYTIRFRYIASENAFHAELAATKDYNLPISGVRGVFASSGGTPVASAMVVSVETIGTGYDATTMNVYSRGRASDVVVSGGGVVDVYSGGVALRLTNYYPGVTRASAGGSVVDATLISGNCACYGIFSGGVIRGANLYVREHGSAVGMVISGGFLHVSGGGVALSPVVEAGGRTIVSSGGIASHFTSVDGATVNILSGGSATTNGTAYGVSVENGGALTVESGGVLNIQSGKTAYGVTLDSGGSAFVYSSGIMSGCSVMQNAQLVVFNGGVAEALTVSGSLAAVASSGGIVRGCSVLSGSIFSVRIGAVASSVIVSSYGAVSTEGEIVGASLVGVNARIQTRGGVVRDAVISSGAYINVSAGVNSNTTILNGGTLTVSAGGSADITDVKSGGKMIVSSGGYAKDITAENPADVVVLDGGTIYPPIG